MKSPVILILILSFSFFSCMEKVEKVSYANKNEISIIDNMKCWKSVSAELSATIMALESDKGKRKDAGDKWIKNLREANENGRMLLYNDTTFIDVIRSDSLLQTYISKRQNDVKEILKYKDKVPFFNKYINKIYNNIIEYNYVSHKGLGIYEYPFNKENSILGNSEFYLNYSELLKEGYSLPKNSDIKADDVLALNAILESIEDIDRKIWAAKHYKECEFKEIEKNESIARKQKIDSLFNK